MPRHLPVLIAAGVVVLGAAAPAVSALPILTHVEAQRGSAADRLVFTFRGGLPAQVRTRAVARVIQDGSGQPITVRGAAFRQVVFAMANAHDEAGRSSCAPRVVTPTLDLLVQAKLAGDFEGQVTYGVGLRRQVAPQVVRRPSQGHIVLVFRR